MRSAKDGCRAQTIDSFNSTIVDEANKCIFELAEYFRFYDGCSLRCITDRSILPLSHYQDLEHIVYGQIFPVIVVLAMLANIAVATVLSKKHMVTPTNVVLRYMAIAELLVGLVPLPWTIFFFTVGNYQRTYNLELWWCYLNKFSMDALPPIFHNIAMWLTVLLAGQRYVSISYPLRSRQTCSVQNVRKATAVIAAVSLLCGLPKSFDYFLGTIEGWVYILPGRWHYLRACTTSPTPLLRLVGQTVFFNVYFWTRTVVFIVLPSVLLVILNVLLIKEIRKAQKRKQILLREKRSEEAARQRDSNSTSVMLVAIVSLFLVVNLPQAAFMAVLCLCETFNIRIGLLEGMFPAVFLLASNMLVMATYPINFSIYCFMSSSFRQTFKALFCSPLTKESRTDCPNSTAAGRSGQCTQLFKFDAISNEDVSNRTNEHKHNASPVSLI